MSITPEQSAAWYEARGRALGEEAPWPTEPPCFFCDGAGCDDCTDLEEHDHDRRDDR